MLPCLRWLGFLRTDACVPDVYEAAAEQGVIVAGGHARTVGAAGGWLTGGGHSAWSNLYGLGVDSEPTDQAQQANHRDY